MFWLLTCLEPLGVGVLVYIELVIEVRVRIAADLLVLVELIDHFVVVLHLSALHLEVLAWNSREMIVFVPRLRSLHNGLSSHFKGRWLMPLN